MVCISSLDSFSLWNLKALILKLSIFIIALCQYVDYYLEKSFIFLILQDSWRPHAQIFILGCILAIVYFPGFFWVGFFPL